MSGDPKATRHSWLRRLFLSFLLVAAIAFFYRRPDSLTALAHLRPSHLLIGGLILLLKTLLKGALSYLIAIRLADHPPAPRAWFQIHVHGRTMNFFTLKAGDLYRAHQAKTRFGLKLTHYAATLLFNAWLELLAMLAAALAATLLSRSLQTPLVLDPAGLTFALLTMLALPIAVRPLARSAGDSNGWRGRLQNLAAMLQQGFARPLAEPALVIRLTALTLINLAAMVCLLWLLFAWLGSPIQAPAAALLLIVWTLSDAVVITPGNVGVREWSLATACHLLGLDAATGLLVSVLLRGLNLMGLGAAMLLVHAPLPRLRPSPARENAVQGDPTSTGEL